jgi:hypothetical protein
MAEIDGPWRAVSACSLFATARTRCPFARGLGTAARRCTQMVVDHRHEPGTRVMVGPPAPFPERS